MAKKIYINPGHSDTDPGAVGYATERELNVKVSNYMNAYLLTNYEVETRMNPGTMGVLKTIANDANTWGADLFVSNHFNAAGGDGYESLIYSTRTQKLGEIFEKHVKAVGQNSRGVKVRNGLAVLKYTSMDAILTEGAFVDNWTDIQDWNDDAELKKLGEAYAKAAAEYLSLPVKKTTDTKPAVAPEASAETVNVKVPVLKKGSEGETVKALQRMLKVLGYAISTIDGDFGSETDAAVRKYQDKAKIGVDGIVGQQTWNKILGIA